MSHELHNNTKIVQALNPSVIASNTTKVGTVIDRKGYDQVEFVLNSGTLTDGAYAVVVEDGEAANLSDAAAVDPSLLIGTLALDAFALTDDNEAHKIGYLGTNRYVRISVVSTGVTTGGIIGGIALLAGAHHSQDISGQG